MARAGVEKAFELLKTLPRVSLSNLKPFPGTRVKHRKPRGQHSGRSCGRGSKGAGHRNTLPKLGFEGGNTPFYLQIPKEPYYRGQHVRRQYPPVSLMDVQRNIDIGRIDPEQPIDLTTICNLRNITIDTKSYHYGINLTDEDKNSDVNFVEIALLEAEIRICHLLCGGEDGEACYDKGVDIFQARVNIEVQWTNELTIAAIERQGGIITTKFYDPACVRAMADPLRFFRKGVPIPRCKLPPNDALEYYSDAKNRGYLADPDKVREAREELAQKYGYRLPDLSNDSKKELLQMRKDPRQIWFGLEPGWVVNLREKAILKPIDEDVKEYYRS